MSRKDFLKRLTPADKLFRVGITLRMVADETKDDNTKAQLLSIVQQLGI